LTIFSLRSENLIKILSLSFFHFSRDCSAHALVITARGFISAKDVGRQKGFARATESRASVGVKNESLLSVEMRESLWNISAKRGHVISSVCATNELLHYALSFRGSKRIDAETRVPSRESSRLSPRPESMSRAATCISPISRHLLSGACFVLRFKLRHRLLASPRTICDPIARTETRFQYREIRSREDAPHDRFLADSRYVLSVRLRFSILIDSREASSRSIRKRKMQSVDRRVCRQCRRSLVKSKTMSFVSRKPEENLSLADRKHAESFL